MNSIMEGENPIESAAETALQDFLKALRISLNFIFLYSKEHTSFLKSITDLQQKLDSATSLSGPLEIIVMPEALSVGQNVYKKMAIHQELGRMLHQRKIKSLRFEPHAPAQELVAVLAAIALPTKDILKKGGVGVILRKEKLASVKVEDLDYSQLLKGDGEETADIWSFLIKDAVDTEDRKKIEDFADNFEQVVAKIKARNFIEDEELLRNIEAFLSYLKMKDNGRFMACTKSLLKTVLGDRSASPDQLVERMKKFFSDMQEEDLAQVLMEQISSDEHFDSASFELFCRITEGKTSHDQISARLAQALENNKGLNPAVGKKLRELFSLEDNSLISTVYRRALSSLSQEVLLESGYHFDRLGLEKNYRMILLNLLVYEQSPQRLELIVSRLGEQWNEIIAGGDSAYPLHLWEALKQKQSDEHDAPAVQPLVQRFEDFIESLLWKEPVPQGYDGLIAQIESSRMGADGFLKKMFSEGSVTSAALRLFIKLYRERIPEFKQRLVQRHDDIEFLVLVMDKLAAIDAQVAMDIMRSIYEVSNDLGKSEVIKAMGGLEEYDKEFLFEVIRSANVFLKKEALAVLSRDLYDKKQALDMLFLIPNRWGAKNEILIEHIGMVEEMDFQAAKDYVHALAKGSSLWSYKLRKYAREVLKRWQ